MSNDGRFLDLPDRDQVPLYGVSLRQAVAGEPDVLAVDEAVEQLDLSDLEARYVPVGAPGYPPKVLLKVLVYGYSLGLRASRQLDRACRLDAAFRFLTHGLSPDFRTLCRFRRQNAERLKALFAQTVGLCQEAGLVSLGQVAVDGTKVRANRAARTLRQAQQALAKALQEAEAADAEIPPETAQETSAEEEARFMKTPAGVKPAYNAQAAVDAAHQVIVAQEVLTAEVDRGQLPALVAQVEANSGQAPQAVLADGGYLTQETVRQLEEQGISAYLPPAQRGAEKFEWVAEQGAYRCPAGEWLRAYRVREGRQLYRTHRCGHCPRQRACGVSGRFKEVSVPLPHTPLGRLARRMGSDEAKAIYAGRKKIVEPVFGWLKHNRGFQRFLLRGRRGAAAEWSLACIAHNLRVWARAAHQPMPAAPLAVAARCVRWLAGALKRGRALGSGHRRFLRPPAMRLEFAAQPAHLLT